MSQLVVISGPSGVGKSTITSRIMEEEPRLERVRSATTRDRRFDDDREKQYDYLSKQEFQEKIEEGAFLEWAQVYGEYYGTQLSELDRVLQNGHIPILEIDIQGAEQIRESDRDHISIFLEPPTFEELESRLRNRGAGDEQQLHERLETARDELQEVPAYDFRIVNDRIDSVIDRVSDIIRHNVSFPEE